MGQIEIPQRSSAVLSFVGSTGGTAEILKASGWPYEIIRRHEEGHCNGFPANHIPARYFVRTPASETATRKWLAE
jgi:hypothetical protein